MDQDSTTAGNGAAEAMLLAGQGALDPRVAAYIEKQGRLADLQSANLVEQNAFELSHLRWRQFNDRVSGVWQILLALSSVAVFVGICAWLWSAHEATGVVVEALHVPPDLAAQGLDGTVLAQRLIDKLAAFEKQTDEFSVVTAPRVVATWNGETKIEIPETGISIDALSQALRNWLGNQTHVSGDVWREGDVVVLAVRTSAGVQVHASGPERDLDRILSNAAERFLAQTQRGRYAGVLAAAHGDFVGALRLTKEVAKTGDASERFLALETLGATSNSAGNFLDGISAAREAQKLQPNDVFAVLNEALAEAGLGHMERTWSVLVKARDTSGRTSLGETTPDFLRQLKTTIKGSIAAWRGAYADAVRYESQLGDARFGRQYIWVPTVMASLKAQAHDTAAARAWIALQPKLDNAAARARMASDPKIDDAISIACYQCAGGSTPSIWTAVALGDWSAAARTLEATDRKALALGTANEVRHRFVWPWLATAYAHLGRIKAAQRLVALTPEDSDWSLVARGTIASLAGDAAQADFWFAKAFANAPDLPFAGTTWGEAKMHRGDLDGAISAFRRAHALSPHYADASELWGEALIAKNRSDLALDKFAHSNKYAPKWGRLHLKWGEALVWLGRKDDAREQFAIASRLVMNDHDKSELHRFTASSHV